MSLLSAPASKLDADTVISPLNRPFYSTFTLFLHGVNAAAGAEMMSGMPASSLRFSPSFTTESLCVELIVGYSTRFKFGDMQM